MVPEGIVDSARWRLTEGINNKGVLGRQLPQTVCSEGPSSQSLCPLVSAYGARSQACQTPGHWPQTTRCVAYHPIPVYVATRLLTFCVSPCCSQKAEQTAWRSSETGLIKPHAHWLFEPFNQLFL